jgi:hypothetical protein
MTPAPVIQAERPEPGEPIFTEQGGRPVATFPNQEAAVAWLKARGFSVGRMQAGSPRGVLFGDFEIMKWRNLRPADRATLHGMLLAGRDRGSRASVTLYPSAPAEAKAAFGAAQ